MVKAELVIVFLVRTRVVKVQVPLDSKMCRYMGGYHIYIYIHIICLLAVYSVRRPGCQLVALGCRPAGHCGGLHRTQCILLGGVAVEARVTLPVP